MSYLNSASAQRQLIQVYSRYALLLNLGQFEKVECAFFAMNFNKKLKELNNIESMKKDFSIFQNGGFFSMADFLLKKLGY